MTATQELTPAAGAASDLAGTLLIEDLHKSFGDLEVLKGVSLTANRGDVIAIIGGSGSGKSTMLRCINFLETPSSGRIVIGGEEIQMRADGTAANRKQLERVLELEPDFALGHTIKGLFMLLLGRREMTPVAVEAMAAAERFS